MTFDVSSHGPMAVMVMVMVRGMSMVSGRRRGLLGLANWHAAVSMRRIRCSLHANGTVVQWSIVPWIHLVFFGLIDSVLCYVKLKFD